MTTIAQAHHRSDGLTVMQLVNAEVFLNQAFFAFNMLLVQLSAFRHWQVHTSARRYMMGVADVLVRLSAPNLQRTKKLLDALFSCSFQVNF